MQPDEPPVSPEVFPEISATGPAEALEPELTPPPPPPPPPAKDPFWDYTDVLIFIGLFFGCMVAAGVAAAFAGLTNHLTPAVALGANCIMYAAIYLSFLGIFAGRYHQPVFRALRWRLVPGKVAGWSLAGAILLTIFVQMIGNLLRTPKIETPMDEFLNSKAGLIGFGLMAVTLAPIFEELVFRGFLQPLFSRTFGVVAGIVITAVLFGALHAMEYHFVWQYIAVVSIVGLALGWIRWRTNSLIPSTIMHASYNGMLVMAVAYSHFHKTHAT